MDASDRIIRAQPLLGTFVEITAAGATAADTELAIESAFAAIARVHRLMSFHDPDSDISRINREASEHVVRVDPWTFHVLETAAILHDRSAGAFDIAIAPVLQEIGLLPPSSSVHATAAKENSRSTAIALLSDHRVRFSRSGIAIDLGGIAKGFAVDRAIDTLRDCGLSSGVVNAGGDLAAFGRETHTVSIRDPSDPLRIMGEVVIRNEALASSGGCFDPFNTTHASRPAVIDPNTHEQIRAILGATVRAPSCMMADALTKVVMIMGGAAADILRHYRAGALMVSADRDVRVSSGWQSADSLAA